MYSLTIYFTDGTEEKYCMNVRPVFYSGMMLVPRDNYQHEDYPNLLNCVTVIPLTSIRYFNFRNSVDISESKFK